MSWWIVSFLEPHLEKINQALADDWELQAAFQKSNDASQDLAFGIVASTDAPLIEYAIVVRLTISENASLQVKASAGSISDGAFSLHARQADWEQFFKPSAELARPYQSFWGMLRILGSEHPEVRVSGDEQKFAQYARAWRIALDRIRDVITAAKVQNNKDGEVELPEEEELEEDALTGLYIWINHSEYGKVKIFYECAGDGPQSILFLHTAGSDSRQYHTLMNNKTLLRICTMYAFDLPGHGRSSLGTKQSPDNYKLTEDSYIESMAKVIEKVNMNSNHDLIVCGASMAGHICIAAAIRARELGIRGSIPCEGCAHLALPAAIYDLKGNDISILDPERVCGMIAPASPEYYKQQIWWQYSSQGTGVFAGDLKFYFKGWDGRDRLKNIETDYCPVYMLTGQYDYSCTTEASEETAAAIPGAVFEAMPGLGHFPLTENPKAVLPYLLKAIDHIRASRKN